MKKELGKWLMDIAKYITTAVVLTSIFGEVEQQWIIYAGGTLAVALSLGWGLYLYATKRKEYNMGALIMFAFIIVVANAAGLYYWYQEHKSKPKNTGC